MGLAVPAHDVYDEIHAEFGGVMNFYQSKIRSHKDPRFAYVFEVCQADPDVDDILERPRGLTDLVYIEGSTYMH